MLQNLPAMDKQYQLFPQPYRLWHHLPRQLPKHFRIFLHH